MELIELRKEIIERLNFSSDSSEHHRIETAYQDFINIVEISEEMEANYTNIDVFELADSGEEKQVKEIFDMRQRNITLLKSAYIFADIFISVLLGEIVGKPGITLNKFLAKPLEPLLSLSVNEILPAYCAVIYRNKIIAHHDVQRHYAYTSAVSSSDYCLLPYSEFFSCFQGRCSKDIGITGEVSIIDTSIKRRTKPI